MGKGHGMRYVKVEPVGKSFDEVCWGQCRVDTVNVKNGPAELNSLKRESGRSG